MEEFRDANGNSFYRVLKILNKNLHSILDEATTKSTEKSYSAVRNGGPCPPVPADPVKRRRHGDLFEDDEEVGSLYDVAEESGAQIQVPNRASI